MTIRSARAMTQIGGIAFILLVPLLNKNGIGLIAGTYYSLSIGPVWITDPVIAFQTLLTTMHMDAALIASLIVPVGAALIFGRVFCGWVCPQNTISELADRLASQIGCKRLFSPAPHPVVRYIVLALLLIATAVTSLPLVSLLSAPGILSVQTAGLIRQGAVGVELALIGVILIAELFVVRRGWCNFICPVGSVLGLIRWKRTMRVVFSEEGGKVCGGCAHCAQACQLGLDPVAGKIAPQCHNCGDCITACEKIDAARKPLSFRF